MINPYDGINLQSTDRILSVSHQHLSHTSQSLAQKAFDEIYATGVRHFPIVQYRPSLITPYDYTANTLRYTIKPIPSDATIEDIKTNYQAIVDIPQDTICSPCAEQIYPYLLLDGSWYVWTNVHMNSVGSEYESWQKSSEDDYGNAGLHCPYSEGITRILNELKYPEGGGVIINHPAWTTDNTHKAFDMTRFVRDCLDYDPRVLGTDMIEDGTQKYLTRNTERIDNILSTGRRCWIFCQNDWGHTRGRNELLIPSGLTRQQKERACLKAYRDGAFFSRYANTDLSITSIGFSSGTFTMTTANADGIAVVIDGIKTEYSGNSVSVPVRSSAKYVRAYAYINRDDDPNWEYKEEDIYKDVVYTNPIMINPRTYDYDPAYDVKPAKKHKTNRFWLFG